MTGSNRGNRFCIFTLFILLALPMVGAAYQERLIVSVEAGECSLRVEVDDQSHTLRLRIHPEYPNCCITKEDMQEALRSAFSKTDSPKLEGIYSSLYLGRLVGYPWLSEYLAVSAHGDPRWGKKKGRPLSMDINKYVSTILSRKEVLVQIEETFGDSGYGIVSVSVEKVLVGSLRDVPQYRGKMVTGKVPYDSQVWFKLEKR